MADITKKFLDLEGLKYFWEKKVKPINRKFTTTAAVGGIPVGTEITEEQAITQIIQNMLCKVYKASVASNPSCTMTPAAQSKEVGTKITLNFATTYTDGKLNSYTGATETATNNINAGCVSGDVKYYFNGTAAANEITDSYEYTVVSGTKYFYAKVPYAASTADAKNSDLESAGISIAAGTCSASTYVRGYYYMWYGPLDTLPDATAFTRTTLSSSKEFTTTLSNVNFNKANYAILVPKANNTGNIKIKDTSTNADLEGNAVKTDVTIKDAGGANVAYYLYTITMADATGLGGDVINISFS